MDHNQQTAYAFAPKRGGGTLLHELGNPLNTATAQHHHNSTSDSSVTQDEERHHHQHHQTTTAGAATTSTTNVASTTSTSTPTSSHTTAIGLHIQYLMYQTQVIQRTVVLGNYLPTDMGVYSKKFLSLLFGKIFYKPCRKSLF
jgi:hypothetical protein